jgi:hypothetical protein
MWLAVVIGLIGLVSVACVAWWLRHTRRRLGDDPAIRDALDCWQGLPGPQRTSRLQAISKTNPDAGVVWYLLGLSLLAEGRRAQGIRALQVSYHREPAFETAALLVFAFQMLGDADMEGLLECFIETWQESGRPPLAGHRLERFVLDCLGADCVTPTHASALGAALCRLPLPELRRQVTSVVSSPAPPQWARPLRVEG